MKLKQLRQWIKSNPDAQPQCYVVAHAGGTKYMVEIEVKHQLEPLRDDKDGSVMHFDNVEQVGIKMKKLGILSGILRLMDPYDEVAVGEGSACSEDMRIVF